MDDPSTSAGTASLLWIPEPKFRGTIGIFSLCLSTMVISVWSAVHFDIPTTRQGTVRSFFTSVRWMLAALFCPELLLFIAFNQRGNASRVVEHAAKYLPVKKTKDKTYGFFRSLFTFSFGIRQTNEENHPPTSEGKAEPLRRYAFTMVHGFYASMGGFVFDLNGDEGELEQPAFLPANRTRMTLTSVGVRFLMEHHPDLIPDLSDTSITDRTRASSLSKAILLAQIAWFFANCIARLGQGLPLSLLEVTTMAHALCTLVTYLLWWSKPLNVAEPTLIRGKEARQACALMAMCSPDEQHALFGTVSIQFPAEMASITTLPRTAEQRSLYSSRSILSLSTAIASQGRSGSTENLLDSEPFVTLLPERQLLERTEFTPKRESTRTPYHNLKTMVLYDSRAIPWYAKRRDPSEPVVLRSVDAARWRLATSAMKRYGLEAGNIELPEKPYISPRSTLQSSSDFKGRGIKAIVRSNLSAMALTLIYGLPHFLAWNARFPTPLEQRLWRVATVAVTLWGTAMALVVALIVIIRLLMNDFTGERRGEALLVACAASLYIITAGYLLVESMRQLFYLEPAAYVLPSWSNYWPHFS